ncbi:LysR family transcriptional regulator [Pseudomonas gingeri]|uniref:LysR family transcriptional regulator n=1 Tax=Pseudomonas gingeri TaxID=117681 RepID=A0A7Y7YB37_9PSED|nr:LysR family transcriptional regulator [Pseudomonas gingeri]NVZ99463.1 LysR family transcriptional regulator [Pseudomonas gingeri]NWA15515.1 LysR family transcriptional regulator [Pseudomonas gingeri]NWA56742.1 LysR family transcriptional regulator [Pseudomonas gingeri]NWA95236.1 LysR family transcriptional regulator [Pseudomonas gingeri]NWB05318.1 LysR family transcriptional regulator [Pseudomonas gingeri]
MAINFDLNDLQAFRAVVEQGSFRKAAQAINISQPALSRRVDKLEEALGVRLFERTTRRVSLTQVGRAFAPTVERLLDDLDLALLGITDVASTRLGHVTVACVPSAAYYFMPKVVAHYHRQYPKIKVKVLDSSANDVHAAVLSGEADFGLSFTGNLQPEIEFELLVEERYVVACRRDHPLAGRASVTWTELYQQDYISLDKTSGNRFLLDQALVGIEAARPGVCETRHVTTMIGLVEAGLGIAAVPTMAMPVAGEHPILTSVPLVEPEVMRKVGLLKRRGRVLTPAALELERLIVEMKVSHG